MKKNFYPLVALLVLITTVLACASPLGGGQPSSPDQVATVVAATLQALKPVSSGEETSVPTSVPVGLLPHAMYFINNDGAGIAQVFRLETDGETVTQFTFESSAVGSYDVSMSDGSVVYVANNQLLLINADGSGRRLLVDGGSARFENDPRFFKYPLSSPVFSPDGQTIAYGYEGLNLYDSSTGISSLVIENQYGDPLPNGALFLLELYWPEKYSPDGTKLLITLQHSDSADAAIYYPSTNNLIRLHGDRAVFCCDDTEWSYDSSSLYAAVPRSGADSGGLWRVDATTGAVATLLYLSTYAGGRNYADEAYLAPDGQLYYFLVNYDDYLDRAHIQLVRSTPDGVTGRTVLNEEDFQLMTDALWAPDASLVVLTLAPVEEVGQGSQTMVVFLDGRPGMILTWFIRQMKWGP